MHRFRNWLGVGMAWVAVSVAVGLRAAERPPNVVFILADDLGWTDAGFAGSRFYETPHLDALATNGMRFTSFYASPNCAPSRASFLTGQYSPRTGVYTVEPAERGEALARRLVPPPNRRSLPEGLATVAGVLRGAGYATGFFGKWHLGRGEGEHPLQRGFDEALVSEGRHFGFETDPPEEVGAREYLADFLTDRSLAFIERHRDRPFFLMLSHLAVHSPHEAKPEMVSKFERKAPAGTHRDPVYAGMIASLDESVGRVMERLEAWGLATHTVVIFTSDNGGLGGYTELDATGRRVGPTDNAPLRGGKGTLHEGGIRVPMVVRWPGVTVAGSRSTQPTAHVDLFPTLSEIAGVRVPEGHVVDGESLVPLLREAGGHLGRDALYWHFPAYLEAYGRPTGWRLTPSGAVRAGNFKLIESFEDGRLELYNLVEDLGEKNNLVRSLPEKAKELSAKLADWRKEVGAAMPVPKVAPEVPATGAGASPQP